MKKTIIYFLAITFAHVSYGQYKHMRISASGHEIIQGLDNMVNTTSLQAYGSTAINNQGTINATVGVGKKYAGNEYTNHVAYADMYTTDHKAYGVALAGGYGTGTGGANCNTGILANPFFTLAMGRWVKNVGSAYTEPNFCRLIWSYDPLLPANISNGGTLNAFSYYFGGGNAVAPFSAVGHHNQPPLVPGCAYNPYNHSYNLYLYDMIGNSIKWSEVVDIVSYGMVAQASDLPVSCTTCSGAPHHTTLQSNYNVLHYPDGIKLQVKLTNNNIIDVSMASSAYNDLRWKDTLSLCGAVDCNYISTIHDPNDAALITYVGPPNGFNGQLISYYNWVIDGTNYRSTTNSITVRSANYGGISQADLTYEVDAGNCYLLADPTTESVAIPHPHCAPPPPPSPPLRKRNPTPILSTGELNHLEIEPEVEFFTYPNPVEGQFTIESLKETEYSFDLIDSKGNLIMSQSDITANRHNVSAQELKPGIYMLKISSNENLTALKLIIK